MNAPHKFIDNQSVVSNYSRVIFCEYCGIIAYDQNLKADQSNFMTQHFGKPCPNSPQEKQEAKHDAK